MKINKWIPYLFSVFLLISVFAPLKAEAHDAYYLQVMIDDHKFIYQGNVISDNASLLSKEWKHLESELGKFQGVEENESLPADASDYKEKSKNDTMPYTFPPKELKDPKNNATKDDIEKAYTIQDMLLPSLNDALIVLNDGKPFKSIDELLKASSKLGSAISNGGTVKLSGSDNTYTITKGGETSKRMSKGFSKDDYLTITGNGESYVFPYKYDKKYKNNGYEDDTQHMTWNMLMYQANFAYSKGFVLRNSAELVKPSQLEEMVVDMFENTFNQIRNVLGLYSLNELVFSEGIRGSEAWLHGIMPKSWSDTAFAYHWLFQGLAWALITFAIVKTLLTRNLATINPSMRISLMENIQNFIITGFLLAMAIPVISMLMFLNIKLVDVFGATAPNFDNIGGLNNYSNMLGGIIIQFFYLGLSIYLNFVYIMRAITISILVASAPLFIITIAFGGRWKQLFWTWMKEIVGNIYLQSFHAFVLSFFFAISLSARGIEGIVVMTALIPLTEFFRKLVLGSAGGVSGALGMSAVTQGAGMLSGAVGKAGGMSKGGGKDGKVAPNLSKSSSGAGADGGMGQKTSANSQKVQNSYNNMSQKERAGATADAMAFKETPVQFTERDGSIKDSSFSASQMDAKPTSEMSMGEKVSALKDKISDGTGAMKDKVSENKGVNLAVGAGRMAVGATALAIGAGTAMAVGMENPKGMKQMTNLASSGVGTMKSGAGNFSKLSAGTSLPNNTQEHADTLPNGDLQIHRNSAKMQENGIMQARMNSEGQAVYAYDTAKLPQADKQNVMRAESAFRNNDAGEIAHWKSQGIESVGKARNGATMVTYNQAGMEKMNIKSVQTVGTGANARIVETKANNAPMHTPISLGASKFTRPVPNSNPPTQNR